GSTFLPPGILALSSPFYGDEMQRFMSNYNRMSVWGVLVEDVHPGKLRFTKDGQPLAFYRVTDEDKSRFQEGIAKLCEIFFAAGAREVHLPIHGQVSIRSYDDVRKFRRQKNKSSRLHLFTVHLMGTCRMGIDPQNSVVGADHRVHGLQNLYISDASVFPSPIRVNPMITIMAMADRAADVFLESKRFLRKAA
ncbi:MAG: GMC family oxidoreductase, partial [bacterium]